MSNREPDFQDADLRDIFALFAMQGILANPNTPPNTPYYVAEDAYRLADVMLSMRAESKE